MDTSDEWIRTRTGIEQRRIAAENEPTSVLGAKAAERALEAAGMKAEELDLIIVGTISPDKPFPNTACFVQHHIGATNAFCFGLEAACSGFIYSVEAAVGMIRSGACKTALVIGAEKLSSIINWQDRSTCVLFGDGAGAVILQAVPEEEDIFLQAKMGSNGCYTDILHIPGGGSSRPFSQDVLDENAYFLTMAGGEVFKLAVHNMVESAEAVLNTEGISVNDLSWLIPHQANNRIISSVARHLKIAEGKTFVNLQKYGNTSAATIPIALDELVRGGQIHSGDYILCVAFGDGLTWGPHLLRW